MLKKRLAAILSLGLVISLVGCGGQEADSKDTSNQGDLKTEGSSEQENEESKGDGEKKVVSFYVWASDAEQEFDKAIVAQYEKEHPNVDIDDNYIPYAEFLSKINTMSAAGNMPDIFNIPEGNVYEWGEKGVLLDLKPLYEEAGVDPHKEVVDSAIFGNDENIWSVSYNVTTLALYYNKDLLKENGIELPSEDASDPWTWEEFVENAKKMTKDSSGKSPEDKGFNADSVVTYGTMMPSDWAKFIPLLYTNGAGIADETGKSLLVNSEKGIEVIQAIADLSLKEHCAPAIGMAKGAFADASAMLMNGQLGMLIDGGWALSNYTNEGFDVGVAQIPIFDKVANMSWAAGLCMSPGAAENKEAFEFYRYFTDFKNSIDAAVDNKVSLGGLPHTLDVFEDPEYVKDWVSTYTEVDATKMCDAFKNILTNENTRLGENVSLKNFPVIVDNTLVPLLDNVWLGEMTAEEALSSLDVSADLQGSWK